MAVTIALLGDVMLGRRVAEALRSRPAEDVWAPELRSLLGGCDAVVVNLECCVSERGLKTRRIVGKSFFFRAPPTAVDSLRAIGASAVSLANNHALDYEQDALADTLQHLRGAAIAAAGAGLGEQRARAPVVVQAGGLRLGVVAVTDHPREFAAGPESWGVAWAPLRRGAPDWLLDAVARLRATCDLVLAFPHRGPNMTTRPVLGIVEEAPGAAAARARVSHTRAARRAPPLEAPAGGARGRTRPGHGCSSHSLESHASPRRTACHVPRALAGFAT